MHCKKEDKKYKQYNLLIINLLYFLYFLFSILNICCFCCLKNFAALKVWLFVVELDGVAAGALDAAVAPAAAAQ